MIESVLNNVVHRLNEERRNESLGAFALIGGFAVSRWGQIRTTDDIDFIISLNKSPLDDLAEKLEGEVKHGTISDPLRGSITFHQSSENGSFKIQLLEFFPAWEQLAFEDVLVEKVGNFDLPIVDWKALVLLKLYAGGPHDLRDAEGILMVQSPSEAERNYLRSKANSLRVNRRLEKIL